ncbi:MAG: acyl-CoA dehydrogenase family protein [Solirubrobacteraceae bacterium]
MTEVVVRNVDGVLAEVRELARRVIAPGAGEIDPESRFPDEHLRALAQTGLLGLLVPCEQGGVGAGLVALADACEAVGGACASTGMVFLMHGVTAATVAGGGGRPRRGWATVAMTERWFRSWRPRCCAPVLRRG